MQLLKDVVPTLYNDIKNNFQQNNPQLLSQLDNLTITRACNCGDCSQFFCGYKDEKDMPQHSLYYDMDGMPLYIMYGLSNNQLTGFEIIHDYEDNYILNQLIEFGFMNKN